MEKLYEKITKRPALVITIFMIFTVVSAVCHQLVSVNYDINAYLPDDSRSTISLDVMRDEFEGGIPNCRVMIENVTIAEALDYKQQLSEVDGVSEVTWLDDSFDITQPLEMQNREAVESYYKDGTALYSVTIEEEHILDGVSAIRRIIGDENAMEGSAVSTAAATENTVLEVKKIAVFVVLFVLMVLVVTTNSWIEPVIILAGLGIAIVINNGTNLIFGEISFVSNAAGAILQLAVSLDYSVFLLHRFEECRKDCRTPEEAMISALCKSTGSILSSGLTTVIGFAALCLMRFKIGQDLGLVLAKGVAISLVSVFVLMPSLTLVTYRLIDKTHHKKLVPEFRKFSELVTKIMIPFVCIFGLIVVPCFLASNNNKFYYGSAHIFGLETNLGKDTAKIEEVFGKSDTYVLLVPKGDSTTEKALSDELRKFPQVTNIISYVDTVGSEIPEEYLDKKTLAKLESGNYSRLIVQLDTDYEGEETFRLVENIRNTADEFYADYYLAGNGVSTYDLMDTVTADMSKVNFIAIGAVFVVLLFTMKSATLPVILVLSIETAVWLNMSFPYFADSYIFYIAYLIISSIQLGATVDYAILLTDRYLENRSDMPKRLAIRETVSSVIVSILTSGSILTVVGYLLGYFSTHGLLAQLGTFIGRGTLCSLAMVLFVLPALLCIFDGLIQKTTAHANFYAEGV